MYKAPGFDPRSDSHLLELDMLTAGTFQASSAVYDAY